MRTRGHVPVPRQAIALRRGRDDRDGPAFSVKEGRVAWTMLLLAGLLEVIWAFFMKQSEGFIRLTPTVITLAAMIASFALLALAMRSLPLGTAYMIWTGIGALGAFVLGAALLGEPVTPARLIAAGLILSGLLLMKGAS